MGKAKMIGQFKGKQKISKFEKKKKQTVSQEGIIKKSENVFAYGGGINNDRKIETAD